MSLNDIATEQKTTATKKNKNHTRATIGLPGQWSRRARVVDVVLPVSSMGFHHSGSPHFPIEIKYGVLAPRSAIRYKEVVHAGAGYCGSRSVCWVYGIIGIVQAQFKKMKMLLLFDYLVTQPDAKIRFHASDMILHIHSDASYLSVSKARSCLGGIFYLGYNPPMKIN
jgi:hypothetical protein